MIRVVIVEDEPIAARKLQRQLENSDFEIEVLTILDSVANCLHKLTTLEYDLLLMDIHLSDGSSFQIFDHIKIKKPIIFTTAFDEYAIQAFKYNSIDYLLKPISLDNLNHALNKFTKTIDRSRASYSLSKELVNTILKNEKIYRKRFLVKRDKQLIVVAVEEVDRYFIKKKVNHLQRKDLECFPIDLSLSQLETELNAEDFFRINRTNIIARDSMTEMHTTKNGRVELKLNCCPDPEFVSLDRVAEFKRWLSF